MSSNSDEEVVEKESFEVDRYGFYSGEQFTTTNDLSKAQLNTLRQRETKWLDMLSNWDYWMTRQPYRLRDRCRKGIPPALRPRVWQYLCGSHYLQQKNPGGYQKLVASPISSELTEQIRRDIHRQFPNHILFSTFGGTGQQSLFNVLKAYCVVHPETGYCQAHAPIASAMLIHMPEEEAFWTFLSICDEYMQDYFKQNLVRVKVELSMLMSLLKKHRPEIHKHLVKNAVEPVYFATDWLMCLLTRNLPWATVSRLLDMFFFEGVKVIFRTILALLDLLLGSEKARAQFNSMDSILNALRRLPNEITSEEVLIPHSLRFTHVNTRKLASEYVQNLRGISQSVR